MRSLETPSFDRVSLPTEEEEHVSVPTPEDEPIPDEVLRKIGLLPRPWVRPLSVRAQQLFLAVAAMCGKDQLHHTLPGVGAEHVQVVRRPTREHRQEGQVRIEVSGFERAGLESERHARGLARVLAPFLQPNSYHLTFSSAQRTIDDAYFGLSPSSDHVNQRREVLGECEHEEGEGEQRITIYARAAQMSDEAVFPNFEKMIGTEMHEAMHTHEDRELAYFVQRVQSESRIKFPYPENFLRARAQNRPVLWRAMANEYRSEFLRMMRALPEIPVGQTIESVAIQYVQDHFPGSSPEAVREDLAAFSAQNVQLEWPVFLKLNRAFQQETVIEASQTLARRRYIDPIPDASLRELLTDILERSAPTETARLRTALAADESHQDLSAQQLLKDITQYQLQRSQQQLQHDRPDQLLMEWEDLVRFASRLSEARFKISPVVRSKMGEGPQTEARIAERIAEAFEQIQDSCFLDKYLTLSPSERAQVLPLLREIAFTTGGALALPQEFQVRAAPYLARFQPSPVIPL